MFSFFSNIGGHFILHYVITSNFNSQRDYGSNITKPDNSIRDLIKLNVIATDNNSA